MNDNQHGGQHGGNQEGAGRGHAEAGSGNQGGGNEGREQIQNRLQRDFEEARNVGMTQDECQRLMRDSWGGQTSGR